MQEGDKTTTIVCGECDQNPCVCPWDNPPEEPEEIKTPWFDGGAVPSPPEEEERERPESVAGRRIIVPKPEELCHGMGRPGGGVHMSTYPRNFEREFDELLIHVRNHELSLLGIKEQLVRLIKTETDILEHLEALDKCKVDLADFEDHRNPTKHPY